MKRFNEKKIKINSSNFYDCLFNYVTPLAGDSDTNQVSVVQSDDSLSVDSSNDLPLFA